MIPFLSALRRILWSGILTDTAFRIDNDKGYRQVTISLTVLLADEVDIAEPTKEIEAFMSNAVGRRISTITWPPIDVTEDGFRRVER